MEPASKVVLFWWGGLVAVSLLNVCLWSWTAWDTLRDPARRSSRLHRAHLALSGLFTLGCAFRSWLPRAEAQRICLVDHWLSSATIARSVATVAELALVAQCTLILLAAARSSGSRTALALAWPLLPLIALAEVFSWYTALTTNFLGSTLEESLWALTGTLLCVGLLTTLGGQRGPSERRFLKVIAGLLVGYVAFMLLVDIPMYASRWARDEAAGRPYLTVTEGWRDASTRRVVTRRLEDWRDEIPWMSLYFSVGVWASIAFARKARL